MAPRAFLVGINPGEEHHTSGYVQTKQKDERDNQANNLVSFVFPLDGHLCINSIRQIRFVDVPILDTDENHKP
jgi:hypothetical protein